MVISLIPTLGAYDTQTFSEHYLHKAVGHLLTQLEKSTERSFGTFYFNTSVLLSIYPNFPAFIAIGHTAAAVGSDMKPFLEPVMMHIKQGLQMRG